MTTATKLTLAPWKKICDKPRHRIKKQRHHFASKGLYSQIFDYSSSHVWMWELDHKECYGLKNWCFWSVVLGKTLESPLDCKEIKPVNPNGNQPWVFIGRTDAEVGYLMWRADSLEKTVMLRGIGGRRRRTTEDEMTGWHHWLDGCEFEWAPGVSDGQGVLACCDSCGRKESDTTEQLNWTELNILYQKWATKI